MQKVAFRNLSEIRSYLKKSFLKEKRKLLAEDEISIGNVPQEVIQIRGTDTICCVNRQNDIFRKIADSISKVLTMSLSNNKLHYKFPEQNS